MNRKNENYRWLYGPHEYSNFNTPPEHSPDQMQFFLADKHGNRHFIAGKDTDFQIIIDKGLPKPKLTKSITVAVDSIGRPCKPKNMGLCKESHLTNLDNLYNCRICKEPLCPKEAAWLDKWPYCKTGRCRIIGEIERIGRITARAISFCVNSITGLDIKQKPDSIPEYEFFMKRKEESEEEQVYYGPHNQTPPDNQYWQ